MATPAKQSAPQTPRSAAKRPEPATFEEELAMLEAELALNEKEAAEFRDKGEKLARETKTDFQSFKFEKKIEESKIDLSKQKSQNTALIKPLREEKAKLELTNAEKRDKLKALQSANAKSEFGERAISLANSALELELGKFKLEALAAA